MQMLSGPLLTTLWELKFGSQNINADALATLIVMRNKLSIFDPGVFSISTHETVTGDLVSFQIG